MNRWSSTALIAWLGLSLFACPSRAASHAKSDKPDLKPKAEHVIVIVWDGLRPDCVNEQDTPTLFRLAQHGTRFLNNHCAYISSTEVNGTAIGTGSYPRHSGIMANNEYRPAINADKAVNTESLEAVRKGDQVSGGKFIALPTLAERVQKAGMRTAIAGTKAVALLLDRRERNGANASPILFDGTTLPPSKLETLTKALGEMPKTADSKVAANVDADAWTTRSLTEVLWADGVPELSMLWLSEPDYAQHGSGPNSPVARQALRSSDENVARLLAALDKQQLRDKTEIFVVSDHGFSTIGRAIDMVEMLNDAGFHASSKFKQKPTTGEILSVGLGGTTLLYVTDRDKRTVQRVVDFLQTSDVTGVIFSRFDLPGTFPLSAANIDTPEAPDLVVSLRWFDEPSKTGLLGLDTSDPKKRGVGQGIHASLSRYDMHNTLIAAGPDIRAGWVDKLPSGNIDVAPTALAILGLESEPLDGRVLSEALVGQSPPDVQPVYEKHEATQTTPSGVWRQYLKTVSLGGVLYIDEGNGQLEKAALSAGSR